MSAKSYPKPPQTPPLFTGSPDDIVNDVNRIIEQYRQVQDQIAGGVTRDTATFANVVLPLAHAENSLYRESNTLSFYKQVSPNDALRDASAKAKILLNDVLVETSMREDLYDLVNAVVTLNEKLGPESSRLLEKMHNEYARNGLGLTSGTQRDRLQEIRKRLAQACAEFQRHHNEDVEGVWCLPDELEGIPEWALADLEKGLGDNDGKLFYTLVR